MNEQELNKNFSDIAFHTMQACINNDEKTLGTIVEYIVKDASEEVCSQFLEEVMELAEDFDKTAADKDDESGDSKLLHGVALSLMGAAPVAYMAHKYYSNKGKKQDLMRQLILEEPDLRENPEATARYLDIISKFSPTMMDAPDAVKNTIREWHRMGGKSIQPEMINKLLDIEKNKADIQKVRHPLFGEAAKGFGAAALGSAIPLIIRSLMKDDNQDKGLRI
jgi:hypothetical protein